MLLDVAGLVPGAHEGPVGNARPPARALDELWHVAEPRSRMRTWPVRHEAAGNRRCSRPLRIGPDAITVRGRVAVAARA